MNISANYKYAIVIKKCMLVFLLSICEIIYYLWDFFVLFEPKITVKVITYFL